MKDLVTKLMNHGFSEHQAQTFIGECYNEFVDLIAKRLGVDPEAVKNASKE